jgi:formate hydrogenlyase subunit 3/multisubunit Na+/H+ antiporter MnhD subunit
VATVFTLAYVLRFFSGVFLGQSKYENVAETPVLMKAAMIGLAALVILLGVWPSFFLDLINTFTFA